jgi:glycosyltransferase involved in cell wall biosynthesis
VTEVDGERLGQQGVATPLVSIILCVRNGLPHVRDSVESVRALTYKSYELIVQDGASTDGTLEYLQQVEGLSAISIVSAPDSGIGQGFNRALQRCNGDIIATVDADNRLKPDSVSIAVNQLMQTPAAAVVYGACDMIAADGHFLHTWVPASFDLFNLMDGTLVPPFATSFFSRARCGAALYFDESLPTVADFDLWLRLSDLPVCRIFDVLADVRVGAQSSTWKPERYPEHSHYKILALQRFLDGPVRERVLATVRNRAEAGIHLWAAESMHVIGAGQDLIDAYFEKASEADIDSDRFRRIVVTTGARLPADHSRWAAHVLDTGVEYLRIGRPEEASIYFELLDRSGVQAPELPDLLARSHALSRAFRRGRCQDVQHELQAEVNRRDDMLAELEANMQAEIRRRDVMLADLRTEFGAATAMRDAMIDRLKKAMS